MRFLCALLLVLVVASSASAGIIYDFVSSQGFGVLGSLDFDPGTSNASVTSGWSDAGSFSSLLEGGVGGFTWEGAMALSGDLSGNVASNDGSELDAGFFSGGAAFPSSLTIFSMSFNETAGPFLGRDTVGGDSFGTFSFPGDWTLRPGQESEVIPEPATLSLLALGGLALLRRKRRMCDE